MEAEAERTEDYSESGGFPEFSFVSTSEEAHSVIEEYEIRTTSRFSCYVAQKDFGVTDFYDSSRRLKVMWEDFQDNSKSVDLKACRLEFDGIPYLSLSWKKFDCHHGQDRKVPLKEKLRKTSGSEGKKRGQVTKKLGCPARVTLREVVKFPEFKISQDTHWYRHEASRKLRSAIKAKTSVGERRIYIYLPKISDHRQHLTGAAGGITQRLDSRIKLRIQQFNAEGQSNVDHIRKELHRFVENELFVGSDPPPLTSRRFYPTKTDIRNHLYLARSKQEKCNTLTPGNISNNVTDKSGVGRSTSRIRRSPRKRKLMENVAFEVLQPETLTDSTSIIQTAQPSHVPLLDSCPEHITEVEISSQEVIHATKSIEEGCSISQPEAINLDVAGTVATPFNSRECILNTGVILSETSSAAVPDVRHPPCDVPDVRHPPSDVPDVCQPSSDVPEVRHPSSNAQADADHHYHTMSTTKSSVSTTDSELTPETRKDHESNPEERHSEINDSTVIDNLNLITQAMEARMLESSQGLCNSNVIAQPRGNDQVAMETVPVTMEIGANSQKQGGCSFDSKRRVGARCRSLLGQIRHMTELVQDDSVLENVQDKLLDIVSYMESHVPLTHEQKDSSENQIVQIVEGQTTESGANVLNIHEVHIVEFTEF